MGVSCSGALASDEDTHYGGEVGGWGDLGLRDQAKLERNALTIEGRGFRRVRLYQVSP
jgi:hypothetical protein